MKNEQSSGRCYLVTGVAGFIASKVAELLLAEGHTVVGVDNLNDYYDVRLKDWRLSRLLGAASRELGADPRKSVYAGSSQLEAHSSPLIAAKSGRFVFSHLDIENLEALDRLFAQWDFAAVFNLAARAGVRASLEQPEVYRRTNVLGEENVLRCQVKYGVKKHVLASSSSVYAGCPMPFTEDAPLGKMQSPYAETKRAAELLAQAYHDRHGLDVTVLRYFTVFGPAGRPDMAPFRFIKWIDEGTPITLYGDGSQARDFTYIDDIARGTVLAGKLYGGKIREQKAETGKLKAEDGRWLGADGEAKLAQPKAETGRRLGADGEAKLKTEESGTKSGSDPKSSAFSFQPSAFSGGQQPAFNIINLGGGNNPISLHKMIGWIEKALTDSRQSTVNSGQSETGDQSPGSPVRAKIARHPASAADMTATWADISTAKRLLNWEPTVIPQEGFLRTVDWHLQNRAWLKHIAL